MSTEYHLTPGIVDLYRASRLSSRRRPPLRHTCWHAQRAGRCSHRPCRRNDWRPSGVRWSSRR